MSRRSYILPFLLVTILFFLWAFLHNINPILIPHLKKACQLSDTQSSFIDASVYAAYFLLGMPAALFMRKYGYKNAIIMGLSLYALGAFLVIPAAGVRNYAFFLTAFFIIASGATFLETAANPYITLLGDNHGAARRLNFAQSFNGIGAFLAPILGGKFILTGIDYTNEQIEVLSSKGQLASYLQQEANTVRVPYLVIGGVIVLLILIFTLIKIPDFKANIHGEVSAGRSVISFKILRHRLFRLAVLSQFFYVGAQVGVGSFFIRFAKFVANVSEKDAAFMLGSIAMVGFMAGRFIGTILLSRIRASRLLLIYALISMLLLCVAVTSNGPLALYSLLAVPFFMSIMYPTIFALGIEGLKGETDTASALLVMAIIGGAVIPLAMGIASDLTHSIQLAYLIPLLCFLVVGYFAFAYKENLIDRS